MSKAAESAKPSKRTLLERIAKATEATAAALNELLNRPVVCDGCAKRINPK